MPRKNRWTTTPSPMQPPAVGCNYYIYRMSNIVQLGNVMLRYKANFRIDKTKSHTNIFSVCIFILKSLIALIKSKQHGFCWGTRGGLTEQSTRWLSIPNLEMRRCCETPERTWPSAAQKKLRARAHTPTRGWLAGRESESEKGHSTEKPLCADTSSTSALGSRPQTFALLSIGQIGFSPSLPALVII